MSWQTIDRKSVADETLGPGLSDAIKDKVRSFFPRYPSKRAALIPALHIVQDGLGYISLRAMRELAEVLEIPPSAVIDVATFYTHFWTHPKGRKTIVLCRSLSCELLGGKQVQEAIERKLGIGEHETTPDGEYSFMTEECLAQCDHAPCMLINEKLHKRVCPEDIERILADPDNDRLDIPRSDLYDAPARTAGPATKDREPTAVDAGEQPPDTKAT
ncbi:MAG: NADH-quinone oxidoreductase subunit NuoE [Planctomycetes bacterium]|nr:NADH-quinone oxidoreductase subunit NuoE [Planctomycetota bacterium]